MNAFLSNLIERAENRAPLLERRPRALFESSPSLNLKRAADSAPEEIHSEQTAMDIRPRVTTSEVERSRDLRRNASFTDAPSKVTEIQRTIERVTPVAGSPVSATAHSAEVFDAPRRLRMEAPTSPSRTDHVNRSPLEKPALTPRIVPAPLPISAVVNRERVESRRSPMEPVHTKRGNRDDQASPLTPRIAINPVPKQDFVPPRRAPAPQREAATAVLLARMYPQAKVAAPIVQPPMPAPIHISIGRVEVRATTAQSLAAPRATKISGPRLKLDDYLNERTRSGR